MTRSIGHASDNTACAPFGRSDTGPHYPCKRIHQSWNRSKKTPSTELLRWDGTVSVNQLLVRNQSSILVLAKDGVGAFVRGRPGQQLLFAVNQAAGILSRQFEAVTMGDCVRGTGFHAVAAKDTAVVIDVVNLGVALGAAHAFLGGVLGGFNVDAVRGTGGGAQETRHTLLQPVLIALQYVHSAKALLEHRAPGRTGTIRIVLHDGRVKHFPEGHAHALGDRGNISNDSHARFSITIQSVCCASGSGPLPGCSGPLNETGLQ